MCHTYLQHYIPCTHTNVSYISCDDPAWYPRPATGNVTQAEYVPIEWRDHTHHKGIAHSYARRCPQCVARLREDRADVRVRGAMVAWRDFGNTGVESEGGDGDDEGEITWGGDEVDEEMEEGEVVEVARQGEIVRAERIERVRRGQGEALRSFADRVGGGNSGESGDDNGGRRTMVVQVNGGRGRLGPLSSFSSSPTSSRSPSPPPILRRTTPQRPTPWLDGVHDQYSFSREQTQRCMQRAEESLRWFDGLEGLTLEGAEDLLHGYIEQEMVEASVILPYLEDIDIHPDRRRLVARSVMAIVYDWESGWQVWNIVVRKLRRLLTVFYEDSLSPDVVMATFHLIQSRSTLASDRAPITLQQIRSNVLELTDPRFYLARAVFEWFLVFLYQHKLACEQLAPVQGSSRNIEDVLHLAWEKYQDVTRSRDRDDIWNVIVDAINPVAAEGTRELEAAANSARAAIDNSAAGWDMASSLSQDDTLAETHPGREVLIPQTIVATAAPIRSQRRASDAADPEWLQASKESMTTLHEPTHCKRTSPTDTDTDQESVRPRDHHSCHPRPCMDETVPEECDTHKVLVMFAGCGHHNAISVEKLEYNEYNDKVTAKCGCSDFAGKILKSQRATSLNKCLVCR